MITLLFEKHPSIQNVRFDVKIVSYKEHLVQFNVFTMEVLPCVEKNDWYPRLIHLLILSDECAS
jgi:hypothetical protein